MSLCVINDVVCRTAFGRKFGEGGGKLRRILQVTQEMIGTPQTADVFPWMGWIHRFDGVDAKLEDTFQQLDNLYESIMDEHLQLQRPSPEFEDFVDVLFRLQKDPSQSISFSRDQIKGILTDEIDMQGAPGVTVHKKFPLFLVAAAANVNPRA
ncbi:hypothetical protein MKX03_027486 [Papaver bracteatum]|nr:hypothetical protein MKX03_027486 [Papaver bracteatum]